MAAWKQASLRRRRSTRTTPRPSPRPPRAACTVRARRRAGRAHDRTRSAIPGTTRTAASVFVLKASPTSTRGGDQAQPAAGFRSARSPVQQASTISRISSGIDAVVARDRHERGEHGERERSRERRGEAEPAHEQQVQRSDREHAGDRLRQQQAERREAEHLRAQPPAPTAPSGGLSTDTSPAGSNETNRKLCHECSIDFTAAE